VVVVHHLLNKSAGLDVAVEPDLVVRLGQAVLEGDGGFQEALEGRVVIATAALKRDSRNACGSGVFLICHVTSGKFRECCESPFGNGAVPDARLSQLV
jgi:hypothetical protein